MDLNIQPILQNEKVVLYPLNETDFDELYAAASDPKIWEQHPNKDRWQKDIFQTFFDGAMQSHGAFKIVEKETGSTIGSTRFYDYDGQKRQIFIGYTFYATKYWGTGINHSVKKLMLDHIFQFVPNVHFHIGANNVRSQIAIGRLGAEKIGEQEVAYFGEPTRLNFEYSISKEQWQTRQNFNKINASGI
jgi:RimJ/RimL family protein N-acetyltransferase